MEETVRYTYRLRPGNKAEKALIAEQNIAKWLWNELVAQQRAGKSMGLKRLGRLLTEARANNAWLRNGAANPQQQTIIRYKKALSDSFKVPGKGRPKVKKKGQPLPSLAYVGKAFSIQKGKLSLNKVPNIPVVWSRELPSKSTSVTVFQDSIGHWYASFVVRREKVEFEEVEGEIGIDWGVKTTATTTDEVYDLPYQGFRKRSQPEIAKQQRKMARRRKPKGQPQSKGYKEAKKGAAKAYKKAQRQSEDTAYKWSKKVVENNQLIAIEDFKPKFLTRSKLAKKAAHAGIGRIKRILIDVATRAGREVVLVTPAYTTMTCSSCFERANQRLELSERVFTCEYCGHKEDRDKNAAFVVLMFTKFTRAGFNPTNVDDVRRGSAAFLGRPLQSELGSSAFCR
jgi:putative transposase